MALSFISNKFHIAKKSIGKMCHRSRIAKLYIDMILAVITTAAIVSAGIWFYVRGDKDPMLFIDTEETESYCLNERSRFIRAEFMIRNIGNVPVSLSSGYFQINKIFPLHGEVERFYGERKFRVQWPEIYGDELNLSNIKIMPNEAHSEAVDFVISTENLAVEVVGIVSQGDSNESDTPTLSEAWEAREIIDFRGSRCKSSHS